METKIRTRRQMITFVILSAAVLLAVLFGTRALGTSATPQPASKPHTPVMEQLTELPRCSDASGRYDSNCWFEDKPNGRYLNLNYGEWTYVLANGEMIHNK